MTPVARLESLARGWRLRWWIAAFIFSATLLLAVITIDWIPKATFALAAALLVLGYGFRPRVDAALVARHLDRVYPTLEESTSLLLVPPGALSAMERIQQGRVATAFAALPRRITLPGRSIDLLWILATVTLAGTLVAARTSTPPGLSSLLPTSEPDGPPALRAASVTITAPTYLGGAARRVTEDADAFEGSRLAFEASASEGANAWLITTNGDSLPFNGTRAPTLPAERSFLYQVVVSRDTFRIAGEWRRITVLPDRAPMLTVVRPEERTTLPSTGPWRVPVEILASDDHGVAEARLLATITTGSGEGVKFREDTIAFTLREPRGTGFVLRTELDLASLGMGPGDELYLSAQAFDRRRPEPNEGRSTTLFISIADTTQVMEAEFDGLAIDRMPDYFRSQRQIIIDTERLLVDRPRISEAEFKRRSNDIGIDQQLLRLRYSEVVGDESSEEPDVMGGREHAADEPADPNAAAVADPNARTQADLTQGEAHSHDIVENATLLARSTKELLRLALNEMWQAEVHLRTFKPDTALPYEHRALEYLEAVRQAARTYVKRVGLEPPPLEPGRKRLTGKLDDIRSILLDQRTERHETWPAIRAVLAGREDRAALEAAGRELAHLAANEPERYLTTLRALREVQEGMAQGVRCAECVLRLRAGLLAALPRPRPTGYGAEALPPVSTRYFDRMRRP